MSDLFLELSGLSEEELLQAQKREFQTALKILEDLLGAYAKLKFDQGNFLLTEEQLWERIRNDLNEKAELEKEKICLEYLIDSLDADFADLKNAGEI